MTSRIKLSLIALLILIFLTACDDEKPNNDLTIAAALSNYWEYQTNLTTGLETRDGTMNEIEAKILAMGTTRERDIITDIDALVNDYVAQSNASAAHFQQLIDAEGAIVPYGEDKGLLGDLANGIYTKAKDTVVGGGRMVRSGWRVLSGRKSLRQVLNDPESGIPIVSSFAEQIQQHNNSRDASIRTSILENNSQDGMIPLEQLAGTTPQEKLNSYLNLSDEDPIKMNTRRDVMYWDEGERTRTAQTAVKLGETGVKTVGDAYGGGVGEYVNEVLNQHMNPGQDPNDKGTLDVNVTANSTGNPPITSGRTLIISKANTPDSDPRITVVMNAPQELEQQLPTGQYNIIVMADGFIRGVQENLQILQNQVNEYSSRLLKLADNPIIIENMTVTEGVIMVNSQVNVNVSCVSTIGSPLTFDWTIAGGTYTNLVKQGTHMSFKPGEEKEYTITVTITDNQNHTKTQSVIVTAIGSSMTILSYDIVSESFYDEMLNPGETAAVRLEVKNTSQVDISGIHSFVMPAGITTSFVPSGISIPAGQTVQVNAEITLPVDYSQANAILTYNLNTLNANNMPVNLSGEVVIPVEFYVDITPIASPVVDRVITVSGKIANPQLGNAILIVDNDPDQMFEINPSNGSFYQQVALSGSTEPVNHTVTVIAISGGLTAEDTVNFTSQVPIEALRATLTWDTNGTDVDFWITDPNGEKCYYANSTTESGLELDLDDTNGYGPENITTNTIIPGDYLVQVHYYSDHDYNNAIYTNCVVVIRQGETSSPLTYYGSLTDTGDIWTVTTLSYSPTFGWTLKPTTGHSRINSNTLPRK